MKPQLRIVTDEPVKPTKHKIPLLQRESVTEIAARLRKRKQPKRPIFVRDLVRAEDEIWL